MWGLSLSKLVFTIFVVIAVWKAFAYFGRLGHERQRADALRRRPPGRPPTSASPTIDLVECPRCGAYVDPQQGCNCGRGRA